MAMHDGHNKHMVWKIGIKHRVWKNACEATANRGLKYWPHFGCR